MTACSAELVPAAAELITLTPGAAAEIARRFGRAATVLPHPSLVAIPTAGRRRWPPSRGWSCCTSSRCDAICRTRNGWSGRRPPGPGARAVGCGSICIPRWPTDPRLASLLAGRPPDGVEFASPSAVRRRRAGTVSAAGPGDRAAASLGDPLRLAGTGPRPRHPGGGPRLRLLRRAVVRGGQLRQQRDAWGWTRPAWPRPSTRAVQLPILDPASATAREAERARVQRAHDRIYRTGGPVGAAPRCRPAMNRPGRRADPAPGGRTRSARRGPARGPRWRRPAATGWSGPRHPPGQPRLVGRGRDRPPALHRPAVRASAARTARRRSPRSRRRLAAGVALSVTLHDLPGGRLRSGAAAAGGLPAGGRRRPGNRGQQRAGAGTAQRDRPPGPQPADDSVAGAGPAAATDRHPLTAAAATDVVVLGFVFPDRGYEQVIAATAAGDRPGRAGPSRRTAMTTCPSNWPGRPKRPATGCGSPDSCPMRNWPGPCTPPASRSPRTNAWGARRRSPPGSATVGGRWCRTRRTPGSWPRGPPARLTLYDADRPGALRAAIERARDDPGSTWVPVGHPARAGSGRDGARVRPALRRLPDRPHRSRSAPAGGPCRTTVGICWPTCPRPSRRRSAWWCPYFEAQQPARPGAQPGWPPRPTRRPGSRSWWPTTVRGTPPDLGAAGPLAVELVRQPDRGFRAAAARNLGAAARIRRRGAVPGRGHRAGAGVRRPAGPAARAGPRRAHRRPAAARRLHRLGRRPGASLAAGAGPAPPELPEPEWLRDGYAGWASSRCSSLVLSNGSSRGVRIWPRQSTVALRPAPSKLLSRTTARSSDCGTP